MQTASSSLSLQNSVCFQSSARSVSASEEIQLGLVVIDSFLLHVLRLILFGPFNDAHRFVIDQSETSHCHLRET